MRPEELTITNKAETNKRTSFDEATKDLLGDSIATAPEKPSRESLDPLKKFKVDNEDNQAFENVVPKADAVDPTGKLMY